MSRAEEGQLKTTSRSSLVFQSSRSSLLTTEGLVKRVQE